MEVKFIYQHCGHENRAGDTHCISCGKSLFVICAACEHVNPAILNYCLECGKQLPKKSSQTFPAEAERYN